MEEDFVPHSFLLNKFLKQQDLFTYWSKHTLGDLLLAIYNH
jgi:hypothetical protein